MAHQRHQSVRLVFLEVLPLPPARERPPVPHQRLLLEPVDFQCLPVVPVLWPVRLRPLRLVLRDSQCHRVELQTPREPTPQLRQVQDKRLRQPVQVLSPEPTRCHQPVLFREQPPVLDLVEPVPHRAEDLRAPQARAQFLRLRSRQQERPSSRLSPL